MLAPAPTPALVAEQYPIGTQYRCPRCGCHVPATHTPGPSCDDFARLRRDSRSE